MTIHFSHFSALSSFAARLPEATAGWLSALPGNRMSRPVALMAGALLIVALMRYPEPAKALWSEIHRHLPIPITLFPNNHSIPMHFL